LFFFFFGAKILKLSKKISFEQILVREFEI